MEEKNDKKPQNLKWLLYKNTDIDNKNFPYVLFLEKSPGIYLFLKTQEKWPTSGKKVFCKYKGEIKEENIPELELIESSTIKLMRQYGKKLTVILNRKLKKRCWFIFIEKEYKNKPGKYYQIFWDTQISAVSERPGAYISAGGKNIKFDIIIDTNERYPYKFQYQNVIRQKLDIGDYALKIENEIIAVAERKTYKDFKNQIEKLDVFKAQLLELMKYKYKVIIFEAPFADFIDNEKLKYYPGYFVAEIITQLMVEFKEIQFVFLSNRKVANEWLFRWFKRIFITKKKGNKR